MKVGLVLIWFYLWCVTSGEVVMNEEVQDQYDPDLQHNLRIHAYIRSQKYDKRVRPGQPFGIATKVQLSIFITQIGEFDVEHMDFKVQMYLRQRWRDERLADLGRTSTLALGSSMYEHMWVPDTFFVNEKKGRLHGLILPNRLLMVDPDGTVLYSQELSVKFKCVYFLHKFPHDNQTCTLDLQSYGHSKKDVVYEWTEESSPVEIKDDLVQPEFQIDNIHVFHTINQDYTGNYSGAGARLYLNRQINYYMANIFIPSILCVVSSWFAFFISHKQIPARVALGLLTVQAIAQLSGAVTARMPAVSYLKAVDVWLFVCILIIAAAFLEYTMVCVVSRRKAIHKTNSRRKDSGIPTMGGIKSLLTRKKERKQRQEEPKFLQRVFGRMRRNSVNNDSADSMEPATQDTCSCYNSILGEDGVIHKFIISITPETIDWYSRIIFPAVYIFFNLVYWSYYYS